MESIQKDKYIKVAQEEACERAHQSLTHYAAASE